MKILKIGKYEFLLDDCDYDEAIKHKWHVGVYKGKPYARRAVSLSRDIMNVHRSEDIVDHANGNTLDNRRQNLRVCTKMHNTQNARKRLVASSKFKGVSYRKKENAWHSRITISGKTKCLGVYKCEREAALAYNEAAKLHFGEYALINNL